METTATVSTDLEAVTDLVLKRQLIDIQRDHAQGIVKMVLECAAEAAGPIEPLYTPETRRLNVTIENFSIIQIGSGFCDHITYLTGWDGEMARRGSAYSSPRNVPDLTALSGKFRNMVGHNVALWVTDDSFVAMPTIVQFNDLGKSV